MTQDKIIADLRSQEATLRRHGVARLFLFGSYARGEAKAGSDIDIFIDPTNVDTFGFDAFMDTYEAIRETFPGKKIGYSTREGIGRHFRPTVEEEAVQVF
jgi:predicted nucleotidyltransferase